jgi:hypothetical protein
MSFNGYGYGQGYMNPYGQMGYGYQMPQQPIPPQANLQQQTQQTGNQFAYCNGMEGAKGYYMPANSTVLLMDNDNPYFYIKTSDLQGRCTIRSFEFHEITEGGKAKPIENNSVDMTQFAKAEDIAVLSQKMDEMMSLLSKRQTPPQSAKKGE